MLKIALSADAITPQPTGIGRYAWEIGKGLERRPDTDVGYFRHKRWYASAEEALAGATISRRNLQTRMSDRYRGWRNRERLVHAPNYFLPDWAAGGVATIHDLSVLRFPETHPPERVRQFERSLLATIDRAQHLITDSETVRRELIEEFQLSPDRVSAAPLGVRVQAMGNPANPSFHEPGGKALTPGYVLCVATLEPRKRIDRLISAYRQLPSAFRTHHPLVLVGHRGWLSDQLVSDIEAHCGEGWLTWLDYVEEEQLDRLYRGAALFVFPSRYEGFGLPPLEAMARGIPTLIGDATSVIEITKGAAKVVDVDDSASFAHAIEEALEDSAWRDMARSAGPRVAADYDWDRCVEMTVAVYRKTLNV